MTDAAPTFGAFWDEVIGDERLCDLPDELTFTERTLVDPPGSELLPTVAPPSAGPAPTAPPKTVDDGDLELIEVLGSGGMGIVHRARQRSLEREVAVKTLHKDAESDFSEALLREACLSGGLDHPNVVPIHSLGRDGSARPLLVMKRVEGHAWNDLITTPEHEGWVGNARWSTDPLVRNLEVLLEVCDAVHFAHSRGVLHRDLKPHNVMVGSFGEVYVMDWGLAVKSGEDSYAPGGSPPYMAPEMLEGKADERTDVYLLGSILCEVLTGKRRHRGPSRLALFGAIAESKPVEFGSDVPAELGDACNRATAADPADRFESVQALRQVIADFLHHKGSYELAEAAHGALQAGRLREARFGFSQALRDWPENPEAQRGLRECLERLIDHELEEGSATAASRLIDELAEHTTDPAELRRLRARVEERKLETERLRQLASDMDISTGQVARRNLLMAIAATVLVVSSVATAVVLHGGFTPSNSVLLALPVIGFFILGTILYVGRRSLLSNVINRRMMFTLLLVPFGIFFQRVVAVNLDLGFEEILVKDFLLMSVIAFAAGIAITRWLLVPAGGLLTGTLIASFAPSAYTLPLLIVTVAGAALTAAYLLHRLGLPGGSAED